MQTLARLAGAGGLSLLIAWGAAGPASLHARQSRQTDQARLASLAGAVAVREAITKPTSRLVVCGDVIRARRADEGVDAVLDLVDPQDNAHFFVVIPEASRSRFSALFVRHLLERRVCFDGRVDPVLGAAGMRVNDPIQLRFVGPPPPRPRDFEAGAALLGEPGVSAPVVVAAPPADYSRRAMESLLQGTVELEVRTGADGMPESSRIVQSLDPAMGLDDEAMRSAMRWRFTPATRDGTPVPSLVPIVVTFTFPGVRRIPRGGAIMQRSGRDAVRVRPVSETLPADFLRDATVVEAAAGLPLLREGPVPPYPVAALAAGIEGTVGLHVIVMPDGTVDRVRIAQTANDRDVGLERAAAIAVLRWRFAAAAADAGAAGATAGAGPRAIRVDVQFGLRTPEDARQEVTTGGML